MRGLEKKKKSTFPSLSVYQITPPQVVLHSVLQTSAAPPGGAPEHREPL